MTNILNELNQLRAENKRLTTKLNYLALEMLGKCATMEKAVEISEMSYNDFLKFRADHDKPMELSL